MTTNLAVVATDPSAARPLVRSTSSKAPPTLDTHSSGSTVGHVAFSSTAAGEAVYAAESATLSDDSITSAANACIATTSAVGASDTLNDDVLSDGSGTVCVDGGTSPLSISRSTISSPNVAVYMSAGSVTDSTINGTVGLETIGPGLTARRDTIAGTNAGVALDGGLIADSVVIATTGAAIDAFVGASMADNDTAIGTGSGSIGIQSIAGSPGFTAPLLVVRNSIARGGAEDLTTDPAHGFCGIPGCHAGSLQIDHSDYISSAGTITNAGANIAADPMFVSSSDYHLRRGSPAIDAGVATANAGATDRDGQPRVVGGIPDMGAFEFQGGAPIVQTLAATNVTATGATLNGSVDPGDATSATVFDYGATTAYGTTASGPSLPAGSGAHPVTATLTGLLPAHTYHVELRATNALGSRTGADVTFTTLAASLPSISGFRFAPSRFREHASKSRRNGKRKPLPTGTHIRFTLSSAAVVRISFAKALVGRRRRGACVAPGRRPVLKRLRCTRYVAQRAVLSLGGLRAGPQAIPFNGRVGKTTLAPGTYRATIVASGAQSTVTSNRPRTTFTIVR